MAKKTNMNTSLTQAKELLAEGDYTCVLCKEESVHTSTQRGIKPLLTWHDSGIGLNGFSAADKVVGRGAAFLYILLGVKEVYAPVMSELAATLLEEHGIEISYETLVPSIVNRAGDGGCPLEQAVIDIEEPQEALAAIKKKLTELK